MQKQGMKTAAFYTLGCKVNQYETEIIKKDFIDNGYREVEFDEVADIYVVNTCTVTAMADKTGRCYVGKKTSTLILWWWQRLLRSNEYRATERNERN